MIVGVVASSTSSWKRRTSSSVVARSDDSHAHRRVAVGVGAIELLAEDALGDRGGHVAHLHEPADAVVAHAREVGRVEARMAGDVGEQRGGAVAVKR